MRDERPGPGGPITDSGGRQTGQWREERGDRGTVSLSVRVRDGAHSPVRGARV